MCASCGGIYEQRYLQVDHKLPYEIGGDDGDLSPDKFQLVMRVLQSRKVLVL
jgi:hypothetical protein